MAVGKWNSLMLLMIGVILYIIIMVAAGTVTAKTITVDDDGGMDYTSIQCAIDNATNGDFIRVFEGTYYENITIDKSMSLIGNGTVKTIINGMGKTNIIHISASDVDISGVQVKNGTYGMKIDRDNASISECKCIDSTYGIHVDTSDHVNISNNIIYNTTLGILLINSSDNHIQNNSCSNNYISISLSLSNNNLFLNNNMSDNQFTSISLINSHFNGFNNNSCSNDDRYGILMQFSNNNSFVNSSIKYTKSNGIFIISSHDNTHINIQLTNNQVGMYLLQNSRNNVIHRSAIENNTQFGIDASDNSGYVIDARFNWWGHGSGPFHTSMNSEGTGNNATDHVDFSNWLPYHTNYLKPLAVIVSITPDKVAENASITFRGMGIDDGTIIYYFWRSSHDGILNNGTENNLTYANLSIGYHTIFFKVQDNSGSWSDEVQATVIVYDIPVASIDEILPNLTRTNVTIHLFGKGTGFGGIQDYHWVSNIDGFLSNRREFNVSNLSTGEHTITLRVSNHFGAWSNEVLATLIVYDTPIAIIHNVMPNPALSDEMIHIKGNGTGFGGIQEFHWASNINGFLSNRHEFNVSNLSSGDHIITLRVRNHYGVWSEEVSQILLVHDRPVASIVSITPSIIYEKDLVSFIGHFFDDGTIINYLWESDIDGILSTHNEFTTSSLSRGAHNISLVIQDNHRVWSDKVVRSIYVVEIPSAKIVTISPQIALEKEMIRFGVSGTGNIIRYAWRSSIDGEFYNGTEPEFTFNGLSNGTHGIFMQTMDKYGTWSMKQGTWLEINGIPEVIISRIAPNPVQEKVTVQFNAHGTDDGSILKYVWKSSLDGELFNGSTSWCECNHLTLGIHTISLTVMDNYGIWSDESFGLLTVTERKEENIRPSLNITYPIENSPISKIATIMGNAEDLDGDIFVVQLSIDNGPWLNASGTSSWRYQFDTDDYPEAEICIRVRAYDGSDHSDMYLLHVITGSDDPEESDGDGNALICTGLVCILSILLISLFIPWEKFLPFEEKNSERENEGGKESN